MTLMTEIKRQSLGPMACIKRLPRYSWCSREVSEKEFLFQDAGHAIKFYANNKGFMACPDCVYYASYAAALSSDTSSYVNRDPNKVDK